LGPDYGHKARADKGGSYKAPLGIAHVVSKVGKRGERSYPKNLWCNQDGYARDKVGNTNYQPNK
jgi:hypothetical protein